MTILSASINSSVLSVPVYDTDTMELTVALRNGTAYQYSDVTLDVFEGLDSAESAGVFFNDNIRNVFVYQEVSLSYVLGLFNVNTYHNFNSSFLRTAQYDPDNGIATITLSNGRAYGYRLDVSCWLEFLNAQSAGQFFNDFISRLAERV